MTVGTPENGTEQASAEARERILCPYCGRQQAAAEQCEACHGLLDPLSRQATQNQMGPWFVRNERNPFAPGMSYDRLRQMAMRGRLKRDSVIRGPSTRQFWALACNTPGIACLLGECHNCHGSVEHDEYMCRSCGVVLSWSSDRQHLGLSPVKLLPGEAPPAEVASSGMSGGESRPMQPAGARAPTSAEVSSWSERVAGPPAVASARAPGSASAKSRAPGEPTRQATAPVKHKKKRSSGSSKRRRKRDVAQRNALIGVIAFSVVVVSASLVAVFGFGVGVGANDAPGTAPAAAPAPVETTPEPTAPIGATADAPEAPKESWLSAGAIGALKTWSEELDEARADARGEDAATVRQAITTLERVLADARSDATVTPGVIAELEKQIGALRARADNLRLKELVGGG